MRHRFFTSPLTAVCLVTVFVSGNIYADSIKRMGGGSSGVKKIGSNQSNTLEGPFSGGFRTNDGKPKCPACGGTGYSSEEARRAAVTMPSGWPRDCKICAGTCRISPKAAGTSIKPPETDPAEWIAAPDEEVRTWTTTNGISVDATLKKFNGRTVVVSKDGEYIELARSTLSKANLSLLETTENRRLAVLVDAWKRQQAEQSRQRNASNCPYCRGTGTTRQTVSTGVQNVPGTRGLDTMKIDAKCPHCRGTGKSSGPSSPNGISDPIPFKGGGFLK